MKQKEIFTDVTAGERYEADLLVQAQFRVEFPDFRVLEFNYRVIQLNRLNWRDYLGQLKKQGFM